MLGSWYPEFVHIHVLVGIHETIKKQPRRFKTLNLLFEKCAKVGNNSSCTLSKTFLLQ